MGTTSRRQKEAKLEVDHKLALSRPDRSLLEELAVQCTKNPGQQSTFQYAFALSKSEVPSELRYAVSILDGLVRDGFDHQVDCMYGAATALYLLGDFAAARVRTGRASMSFCAHFLLKRFFLNAKDDYCMMIGPQHIRLFLCSPRIDFGIKISTTTTKPTKSRCEAILRVQPHSRIASELHLAAMEAEDQHQKDEFQKVAMNSVAAAAAIGIAAGVVRLLLTSGKK